MLNARLQGKYINQFFEGSGLYRALFSRNNQAFSPERSGINPVFGYFTNYLPCQDKRILLKIVAS